MHLARLVQLEEFRDALVFEHMGWACDNATDVIVKTVRNN